MAEDFWGRSRCWRGCSTLSGSRGFGGGDPWVGTHGYSGSSASRTCRVRSINDWLERIGLAALVLSPSRGSAIRQGERDVREIRDVPIRNRDVLTGGVQ